VERQGMGNYNDKDELATTRVSCREER